MSRTTKNLGELRRARERRRRSTVLALRIAAAVALAGIILGRWACR